MLLLPDEVLRFPLDQALVIIRGQKILRVRKMDYTMHPDAKNLSRKNGFSCAGMETGRGTES